MIILLNNRGLDIRLVYSSAPNYLILLFCQCCCCLKYLKNVQIKIMLLYSAISKGSLILCDYCESDEDLTQLTQKQLKSIRKTQEMQIFQSDGFCLFVLQQQEYNFMCITQWKSDLQAELKVAQHFLSQISLQFSQVSQSPDFDSGQFTKNLAESMQLYKQNGKDANEEQYPQQNQEVSMQKIRQENPQQIQKSSSQYSVYTCKSLFFIINLFMAGMLIEFLNKLNKQ